MNLPDRYQSPILQRSASRRRWAFTLTELLIVIGIIVLFVTLALPAFNLIGGTKSIAGAENEISALLGRAHSEAAGAQDYRGLAIYRDAVTDRYAGAIVSFPVYSTYSTTTTYSLYSYVTYISGSTTHYYVSGSDGNLGQTPGGGGTATNGNSWWYECAPNTVDITSDSDSLVFPAGVGVEVINNCPMNGTARLSSGYLPIGVILFNGSGVMALKNVSFAEHGHLGTMASFSAYNQISIPNYVAGTPSGGLALSSSFGLVAFDKQTFDGQGYSGTLPSQLTTTGTSNVYSGSDSGADSWLDTNSTPLLINRYNGTLVRSE